MSNETPAAATPWPMRAAAAGAYAGGLVLLALTCWRGWIGRPFAVPHVIYVDQPIPHLLAGLAALFAGYVLQRGYRNGAREWGRLAGKSVMLAISVALSLLVAEVGYRALLKRAQEQNSLSRLKEARESGRPLRVHSTHPLAAIVELSAFPSVGYELQRGLRMDFGHHPLRTNGDGMREDRDYAPGRLAGGVRIVGIGDSGMFGWSCDQGQAYMDVLEQRLQARAGGIAYEVLNLAVPGYNTRLELESLKTKGLKYEPDIVVLGWCANDYDRPFFVMDAGAYRRRDVSFLYAALFDRDRLTTLMGGRTVRPGQLTSGPEAGDGPPAANSGTASTDEVAAALRELVQVQQQRGFKLLVFGPMDDQVLGLCRTLHIAYFNTLEKVDGSAYPKEWAVHFMHPRPEGHRVLGEHLERELDRLGWLTPRP